MTSAFDLEAGRRSTPAHPPGRAGPRSDPGQGADRARPARGGGRRRCPRAPGGRRGRGRRDRTGLVGGRATRRRDHPAQDPARRRVGDGPGRARRAQCGRALAAIHAIEPDGVAGLPRADPLARSPAPARCPGRGAPRARARGTLARRAPPRARPARVTVHGDFRCGNLLVDAAGLRGVLDWELAHAGDPAEDIGWLCAPAWRFGGPGEVGGFGRLDELLDAYADAGGGTLSPARVHWWQVYATVKWAAICALQAATHLGGLTRSVELAAIGRRVCESEWDLFALLGVTPPGAGPEPEPAVGPLPPFGRPSAAELVEAVREYLDGVTERGEGAAGFEARVARNALAVVERELQLGPALARTHAARLAELGFDDDAAAWPPRCAAGTLDQAWDAVAPALAASARDQLRVANPSYLPAESE